MLAGNRAGRITIWWLGIVGALGRRLPCFLAVRRPGLLRNGMLVAMVGYGHRLMHLGISRRPILTTASTEIGQIRRTQFLRSLAPFLAARPRRGRATTRRAPPN